ncbi:S8 family peptidase [Paenibacillus eucommiae]|uniref:Subtilisin n=1 Tax=Paenibacillus eucommiae TaxID=1355755 RepID=A0ABS4J6T1_9BACL|nr:S8 family peptidase [Paenibacillus eucommiae]MBP1994966.1 subtilisin [Paenibacillus eucommiae]
MDMIHFLHMLHEEIGKSQGTSRKHIIHFRTAKDYRNCRAHLKRLKPSLTHLSKIRDLNIIHAFSCSLKSDALLRQGSLPVYFEEDIKIKVHGLPEKKKHRASIKNDTPGRSQIIPWGVDQIMAPQTWNKSVGSRVSIGVIDTGIDYNHPDLSQAISRGINLINRNLLPFDDNGHGTHIAGTIAAASSNGGIVGVAPRAIIHPVKAFDHNGSAYVSDIIAGIDWCVHNDLDIINMSFGMKTYNKSLEYAVLNAYHAGKIIVASSGNDGHKASIDYPARFTQVVSVGATTRSSKIAPFSNRGSRIDIYAPGDRIYSSWLHGKYNELSGTSMATAHVSGVIALMLAIKPGLRPLQIKNILKRSSISLSKTRTVRWQAGQINARRALSALD